MDRTDISTYLARKVDNIELKTDLGLIIDSEFHSENDYTIPIECKFEKEGKCNISKLNIKHTKGEAEMAMVDWLLEFADQLKPGDACASIVTSGDIDAVVIHLFAMSFLWPRKEDGKFKNPVYVILQKAGSIFDIYNVTQLIEILESAWHEKYFAAKVAIGLSLGGNDFLLKFHNITHSKTLELFCSDAFRTELIRISVDDGTCKEAIDKNTYFNFIKHLYCSQKKKTEKPSFDEIRFCYS